MSETAPERLSRLLALVPWLRAHDDYIAPPGGWPAAASNGAVVAPTEGNLAALREPLAPKGV